VAAAVLVAARRPLGRARFAVAALAPAATAGWAVWLLATLDPGEAHTRRVEWVPGLDLTLGFRADGLAAVMALVIGAIGVLVCAYAASYFGSSPTAAKVAPLLVAFAGSMLGLVLSDDVLGLFVFWELTSVTSFLLIGTDDERPEARAAAQQAFLITGAGGLALLGGLVLLGQQTGEWTLQGIVAAAPSGGLVEAAAVLVLLGALTKSAQVPFHSWLPGAMAAPTPVSAYLHSATMVKAGVYLVARLSPGLAELGPWRPVVVGAGVASLLVGGWRALRQSDLKILLAMGTVSQLGLLMILFGVGTEEAWAAGVVLLVAHALFKAPLFMVVGIVDHATHTRDIRRLDRLGRRLPVLCGVGVLAASSMAGVPPLLGFIAKEEALAALGETGLSWGTALLVAVVAGSVLTVAYSGRFVFGAFGPAPDRGSAPGALVGPIVRDVHTPAASIVAVPAVLAGAGLLFGLLPVLVQPLVDAAVTWWGPDAHAPTLALWHGLKPALYWSLLVLTLGSLAIVARSAVERVQVDLPRLPGTQRGYERTVRGLLRGADRVTGVVQSGSLPTYLAVILVTMVVTVAVPLSGAVAVPEGLVLADSWGQLLVAAGVLGAALGAALALRRMTVVLLLGVVGYGVAALFMIQGAPDLAVTQLLVETLTVVAFVLVLRRMPERFAARQSVRRQLPRAALALAVGAVVFVFALSATVRTEPGVSEEYLQRSLPEAAGRNVVNVIVVDFRGLDTLGEISVVLVAALGISALSAAGRRGRGAGKAAGTGVDAAEEGGVA
jgi:multicomponent Na+:H+ antiporter subunit A